MTTAKHTWSLELIISAFPNTVLPNIKIWNVTNHQGRDYQILLSWPLRWKSPEEAVGTALSMYVLDGNALGMTATEAWRRRAFVDPRQPDGIVVSIGYPVTDAVYSAQRNVDFQPRMPGQAGQHPSPPPPPITPPTTTTIGADELLQFIEGTLQPFVRLQFPRLTFGRDALYGHSLGGLFVVYALLRRPGLFDTFLAASPGTANWDGSNILEWKDEKQEEATTSTKPALRLAYGTLEAHPAKHRVETEDAFEARVGFYALFDIGKSTNAIYRKLKEDTMLRDIQIKEYPWSDHASLGAVGLTDGIDYFIDW